MAAMTTVPSYTASIWVRMCHALPRLDFGMQMRDNLFVPDSWEYQQTLLVLSSLSAIALVISLLVVLSFLIHYCCCHRGDRSEGSEEEEDEDGSTGHGYSGKKGKGICCVTWVAVAAVTLCCVAIGIGFYGNSEANDGMYQLTSSLLTANYTLASIDLLISDTISGLQLSVSGPLASMEELFSGSKPFLVSTRNCRRLSENVISLLSSISLARPSVDAGLLGNDSGVSGASITPLTPVPPSVAPTVVPTSNLLPNPFSPGWAANTLMVNEDYRWLSYVLLLLLDLIVCLFILLGLAKQARWLLILMTVLAWLFLFLSWGSLGLETATVVALSDFCSDPNSFVLNSTQFNMGTSSDVLDYYLTCSRRMNSPFQQLLTQSQRALSNIHSHLSSLDRNALPQFPKAEKSLREVQQILNSTEGNFHQLVALLNCRGLNKDYIDSLKGLCYDGMEGLLYLSLYSFLSALAFTAILCALPGAWRSFPRTPNVSSNGNPGYESLPLTDRQSPPPSYSPSMLTGYGGNQSHPNPPHSRNLYSR
ncbi:protein tweety homolog 1 isoform X2 [Austrofundulus limnaeus]|uniref:Protein tweety homolog n=1 Tax=Austrofundulus limnaeus TaxID=52670 RepID=A0A2I4BK67_AUSLI|nr:PREDICTED: protein tweety homolog 1 isoform X2 [Austrofundulus limnaeus]